MTIGIDLGEALARRKEAHKANHKAKKIRLAKQAEQLKKLNSKEAIKARHETKMAKVRARKEAKRVAKEAEKAERAAAKESSSQVKLHA